ncbi:MAG: tRNA-binding protein [Nitriliruptor sp.]
MAATPHPPTPPEGAHRIDAVGRPYDPDRMPRKDEVGAAGYFAVDLRVGRVTAVEPFPEARDPAWKLTVDFGPLGSLRTSAKVTNYAADELLGRQVVGAVNLGAKRIAGFVSEFLVLGGLEADGTVRLLAPDADLPPGSVVA